VARGGPQIQAVNAGADERCDLLDEHGTVTGSVWRSEAMAGRLRGVRGVNALLVNAAGELWIPRRAAHKVRWPGHMDFSVGGGSWAGEDYDQTLARETQEELGLDVSVLPCRVRATLNPYRTPVSSFMRVYELTVDAAPPFNPDDFSGGAWLDPPALLARIAAGDPAKPDLETVIRLVYASQLPDFAPGNLPLA
jgi:isopentenyldiphosphate isomerase